MRRMRLYLSLLVITAMMGATLGVPSPGSADDQTLILAQWGARDIQRVEPPPAAAPPRATAPLPAAAPPPPSAMPDTMQRPVETKSAIPDTIPKPADTKGSLPIPIPRPGEIRQTSPPEGMPADVGPKPAGEARRAGAEPGLQLGGLGLSSTNPRVGERVFVTTTLRNVGSRSFSGVRVRFFLDQAQVGEKVVAVPAGGSATASASFKAAKAGAQNVRLQVDPGSGIGALTLARGLTVTGAAKKDMEDFTPPTTKPATVAKLPPQRLPLDKPQAYAPAPDISRKQPLPDKGKGRGDQGKKGPEGGIPLGDRPPSPIPEDLEGQTKYGKGPGGKVIGRGDGIYGVDDEGKGVPIPEGISELDKLLDYGKWPSPATGGPDLGFYHGVDPSKGPGKWAEGEGGWFDEFYKAAGGGDKVSGRGVPYLEGDEVSTTNPDGSTVTLIVGTNQPTPDNIKVSEARFDKKGNLLKWYIDYGGGTWSMWVRGSGGDVPEGADAKPSPKTPDPNLVLVLMKAPPGRHTDPRIGKVGDPPAMAGKAGAAPAGAGDKGMAAGGGKIIAGWQFAGVKPGAFLKGPRDPNLPGGRSAGGGLRPDLPIFTLPDPPEAKAITAALARAPAAGAQSVTVSAAAGAVQVLATREGKQGWTPLTAGSKLAANSVIRVDKGTGGEVGVGDPKTARAMSWTKIHSGSNHVLYQLQVKK